MKRMISLLLVFTMMVSILPAPSFGEEFFSEESFGAATFEDETFFEDEDFSAFFAEEKPEEEIGAADLFDESFATEESADEVFSTEILAAETQTVDESADPTVVEVPAVAELETEPAADEEAGTEDNAAIEPETGAGDDIATVPAEEDVTEVDKNVIEDAVAEPELFSEGYAKIAKDTEMFKDENAEEKLGIFTEDSVLYATARIIRNEEGDLLAVRFIEDEIEYEAFILADAAVPMTEEETAELKEAIAFVAFAYEAETRGIELEFEELESRAFNGTLEYEWTDVKEVKLTWYDGDPKGKTYNIYVWEEGNNEPSSPEGTVSGTEGVHKYNYSADLSTHKYGVIINFKIACGTYTPLTLQIALNPPVPDAITVQPGTGSSTFALVGWTKLVDASDVPLVDGYVIERKVGNGSYSALVEFTATEAATEGFKYEDHTVTVGNTYTYRIATYVVVSGQRKYSEWKESEEYNAVPGTPENLQASVQSLREIKLTWNKLVDTSTNKHLADGYQIYYQIDGMGEDQWIAADETASNAEYSFAAEYGTEYWFCVAAYKVYTMTKYDEYGNPYEEEYKDYGLRSDRYPADVGGVRQSGITTYPAKVNDVKASGSGDIITVEWTANSDGVSGYYIYCADGSADPTDPSEYSVITTITKETTNWFKHEGLSVGDEYYYIVVGFKGSTEGVFNVDDRVWACIPPEAPENLIVTNGSYDPSTEKYTVHLEWDAVTGADGYNVYRRAEKEKEFTCINKLPPATVIDSSTFVYDDTTAVKGTKYYYYVKAYVSSGSAEQEGPASETVTIICSTGTPTITTVSALDTTKASGFHVQWDQEPGADGYVIRIFNAKDYHKHETDPSTTLKAVYEQTITSPSIKEWDCNKGINGGIKYIITLTSFVKVGSKKAESEPAIYELSGEKDIRLTMGVPTKLNFASNPSAKTLVVTWDKVFGISGYRVYISSNDNDFGNNGEMCVDLSSTVTSYTIKPVKMGYKYEVTIGTSSLVDGAIKYTIDTSGNDTASAFLTGALGYSGTYCITDFSYANPPAPAAPTLKISYDEANNGKPNISISWKAVAGISDTGMNGGYAVQRRLSDGKWKDLDDNDTDATNHGTEVGDFLVKTDELTDSLIGYILSYRIVSYVSPKGTKVYSAEGALATIASKIQTTTLKLDHDATSGEIVLEWDEVYGAKTVRLWRGTSSSFNKAEDIWEDSSTTLPTDYTDSTAVAGKKYYYWIEHVGAGGLSTVSKSVSGYVSCAAPTGLTVDYTKTYAKRITVSWDSVAGAKNYVVYYWKDGVKKKAGSTKKTEFTITKLDYDQYYGITVTASNGKTESAHSIEDNETTQLQEIENPVWTVKSPTSVELSWDKQPDVSGYYVTWTDKKTGMPFEVKTSSNKYTLKGLEMCVLNDYYVYPYIKIDGQNKTDAGMTYKFEDVASGPAATGSISVTKNVAGETTMSFSWKEVKDADGYVLSWVNVKDDSDTGSAAKTSALKADATSLTVGATYKFTVTPYLGGTKGAPKTKQVKKR